MSATDYPKTFSELRTDLLNRVRADTSISATANQASRYLNIALYDLHLGFGESFSWAERSATLRTQAPYSTGTVTITTGSTTLSGSDTRWDTDNDFSVKNVRAGGKIVINGGTDLYEVSSIASDTSLTLTQAFISDDVSDVDYEYFEDEYDLDSDFLRPLDFQRFSSQDDIPLIDRRDFRRAYPRNRLLGKPRVATLVDRAPSGDATVRRRIRFNRPPDAVYLIPYNFVTNKLAVSSSGTEGTDLSGDADEPIVPVSYRYILVVHALKSWYRDKKDDARSQEVQAEWLDMMRRIVGDQEIGAKTPVFRPRVGGIMARARRPWGGGGARRFVTGSRFDEMR